MLFLFQQSQFSILSWCFQQVGLGCWFLFPPRKKISNSPTTNNTSQIPKVPPPPRYFWEKPLLHQPTKKSNEKNKANNTTPWFLRQVLRVPLPPSGKTRSSPHQWHRRRVDNVSQVEGHNSWIHRCSLWKNVGMVGSRSWSAKAGVAWSWLVASIKNIYIYIYRFWGIREDFRSAFFFAGRKKRGKQSSLRFSSPCCNPFAHPFRIGKMIIQNSSCKLIIISEPPSEWLNTWKDSLSFGILKGMVFQGNEPLVLRQFPD